jgi:hypothetical protein
MTSRTTFALIAILSLPALARAAEPAPMQDGLWEVSMKFEIPGLPFQLPAQTATHCYTKKEIEESSGMPKQSGDCKVTDLQRSGNKITWKTVCTGKNAGTGTGEIAFTSATAYEGTMKLENKGQVTTTRYQGKRLGDCK